MKNYAIVVFREDGTKFIRSYHYSVASARRIVKDLSSCPYLSSLRYKVFDLVSRCYC